jgi:hypothetical protein
MEENKMPGPLFSILTAIPWSSILKNAPAIVKAANDLLTGTRKKAPALSAADELAAVKSRLDDLETHDRDDAELIKRLADQLEILTFSTRILAGRLKLLVWLAGAGLALGLAAVTIALL